MRRHGPQSSANKPCRMHDALHYYITRKYIRHPHEAPDVVPDISLIVDRDSSSDLGALSRGPMLWSGAFHLFQRDRCVSRNRPRSTMGDSWMGSIMYVGKVLSHPEKHSSLLTPHLRAPSESRRKHSHHPLATSISTCPFRLPGLPAVRSA